MAINIGEIARAFVPIEIRSFSRISDSEVVVNGDIFSEQMHHRDMLSNLGVNTVTPQVIRDITNWNADVGRIISKAWLRDNLLARGFTRSTIESIIQRPINIQQVYDSLNDNTLTSFARLRLPMIPERDINMALSRILNLPDATREDRSIESTLINIIIDNLQQLQDKGYALYDEDGIYAVDPIAAYSLLLMEAEEEEYDSIYEALRENVRSQVRNNGFHSSNNTPNVDSLPKIKPTDISVERYFTEQGPIRFLREISVEDAEQSFAFLIPIAALLGFFAGVNVASREPEDNDS